MEATPQLGRSRWWLAGSLTALLASTGCCGSFVVSGRYHYEAFSPDDVAVAVEEPNCGAEHESCPPPMLVGPQIVLPAIPLPDLPSVPEYCCEKRQQWQQTAAAMQTSVAQFLQPGPPPPVKPPHSRFHPLPTQPVFAPRPEYKPPELLGIEPKQPKDGESRDPKPAEEIPTPAAEIEAGELLREPTWHDLPPPRPLLTPAAPEALPMPQPRADDQAPRPLPHDESRGSVAPIRFEWVEPNPLRAGKK